MTDALDTDLRDAFRLLYEGDDSDAEEESSTVLPDAPPGITSDLNEKDVGTSKRFTKRRFAEALDSLVRPGPKRARVYPTRKAQSSIITSTTSMPDLPSPTSYAPFSATALLSRLRTFRPSTWSLYPPALSSLEFALHGWRNVGREGVACASCGVKWGLGGFGDIKNEAVRAEMVKRLAAKIESAHSRSCAWRIRSCPPEVYGQIRQQLNPMITSSLSDLGEKIQDECLEEEIDWTSPMSSTQAQNLYANISGTSENTSLPTRSITPASAAMAFFAWYPYQPNGSSTHITPSDPPVITEIVQCRICERRVGLWAFRKGKGRAFDLVSEHLSWCPIRSGGSWWEYAEPLKHREKGAGAVAGWIKLSEKLEKKPWRKSLGTQA